jgi:hypothetical protein
MPTYTRRAPTRAESKSKPTAKKAQKITQAVRQRNAPRDNGKTGNEMRVRHNTRGGAEGEGDRAVVVDNARESMPPGHDNWNRHAERESESSPHIEHASQIGVFHM